MPSKKPPSTRIIRLRASPFYVLLKGVSVGLLFGLTNQLSVWLLDPAASPGFESLRLPAAPASFEFDKNELFEAINRDFHLLPAARKPGDFLKNFTYGVFISGVGGMLNLKVFSLFKLKTKIGFFGRVLLGVPMSVLPYYAYCGVWDGKLAVSALSYPYEEGASYGNEGRYSGVFEGDYRAWGILYDMGILTMGKIGCDFSHNWGFVSFKAYMEKMGRSRMDLNIMKWSGMMVGANLMWIFLLVSVYHGRIGYNRSKSD